MPVCTAHEAGTQARGYADELLLRLSLSRSGRESTGASPPVHHSTPRLSELISVGMGPQRHEVLCSRTERRDEPHTIERLIVC